MMASDAASQSGNACNPLFISLSCSHFTTCEVTIPAGSCRLQRTEIYEAEAHLKLQIVVFAYCTFKDVRSRINQY